MPKRPDFIKDSVVKDYIKTTQKLRSTQETIEALDAKLNSLTVTLIKEAATSAKGQKRKTILLEDIRSAYEKHVGKESLTWQELLKQILRLSPADLSKTRKGIHDFIEKT